MDATDVDVGLESLGYHPKSAVYRAEYDREATSASMAVVAFLSEVMDVDPTEMDSLYASVDTDALDALFRVRGAKCGAFSIEFLVAEHAITVYSSGTIAIVPPGDRPDDPTQDGPHT